MAEDRRPARPLRRLFGLTALAVAAADIASVAASPGSPTGAAAAAARLPVTIYGVLLLAVGVWAIASSRARDAAAPADGRDGTSVGFDEGEERAVIHALRDFGWYVADDVSLPHAEVDHIAVGPAGVLAVQVQWTNRPDARGKPAIRARVAAQQLRKVLAEKELSVEVVPVVLAFGPGLTRETGGVKVVDTVAILNGYQAEDWIAELERRALLDAPVVDAVRELLGDLRERDATRDRATREAVLVS